MKALLHKYILAVFWFWNSNKRERKPVKSSFSAFLGPTSKQVGDPTAALGYGNWRKENWPRTLIKPGLVCLTLWPLKQDLGFYGVEPGRGWEFGQIGRHVAWGPWVVSESVNGEKEATQGTGAGISPRGSKLSWQGPPTSTQGLRASLMGQTKSPRARTEDVDGGC